MGVLIRDSTIPSETKLRFGRSYQEGSLGKALQEAQEEALEEAQEEALEEAQVEVGKQSQEEVQEIS